MPDQIRLLVVEDVPQVAQYIRGLLNSQTTIKLLDVVSDGTRVAGLVQELRPDVIIVDALLQGRLKGMTLVQQLHASGMKVPLIVLTVPQHPVQANPGMGIDAVLSMPFTGYELVMRVQGGTGKTTICFNLAVAFGQAGLRTVLIDGGLQFGDMRALLKVPIDAPSMLVLPTDRIQESDLADVLWRDQSGIDILLAPPRVELWPRLLERPARLAAPRAFPRGEDRREQCVLRAHDGHEREGDLCAPQPPRRALLGPRG